MELLNGLLGTVGVVVQGAALVVAGASVLSKLTPTPKDDTFFAKAQKVIDFLALVPKPRK